MIVNLWSGPRNISTALMYSFANREDCTVLDEPYYAHYLERTGLDHPGREEVLQSQSAVQADVDALVAKAEEKSAVLFIKNMAHHAEGLDLAIFGDMKNVFLLREPDQTITSFMKQIPNPTLQDVAYEYQYKLLQEALRQGDKPIVIDSRDLLSDPEGYLKKLCAALGIPFSGKMLSWEKGAIEEDGVWAEYWYAAVHNSTGFQPYKRKEEEVPDRLQGLLEKCNHYYNQLINHKL